MKFLYLTLITAFITLRGVSQSSTHYFKNYQVADGLSSNTITAITQDKKGFMWFGSRNGLNRFDGNKFKVFKNKLLDPTSLGSNSILSLHEDEKQQLWVGTYRGIYIYNPVNENFKLFKFIPPGEIRFIQGDSQHNIWVISNYILYKFNQLTHKITVYPIRQQQTIALHVSQKGTVLIATNTGLIKKYIAKSNQFTAFNISKIYGKNLAQIKYIYSIGDTAIMVGTVTQTLLVNLKNSSVKNIVKNQSTFVHTISKKSYNEFWIGTEAGLFIYNLANDSYKTAENEAGNPYSITDNVIYTMHKDREGGTWIGTFFGGINYYSKQSNNFSKYFPKSAKTSLSGNIAHEICRDKYGKIWIGTEDAGLNQLNLANGKFLNFLPDKKPGSISYHNIHGLIAVNDELWIGTLEHGLDVMDLRTNKIIRHYNAAQNSTSFTSDFIVSLYKRKNGDILIGTWNGLFKYNRKTDNFSLIPFFYGHIQTISEDAEGTLWVGTYGNGAYYANEAKNKRGHIIYKPGIKSGLINNYVNNVYLDSKKNVWFCTEGGLSHYAVSTGKIISFTTDNGLPDNQIFRILEDDSGKYWISTARGLSNYNQATLRFNNYHGSDGLPTEQFNYNSAFKNTDGTLFFGTIKGLISFKPSELITNHFIPPVYITGLQINNKDVLIKGETSPLKKAIIYTKELVLPYDEANINFDIAALSYIIPERNEYQYKMEGLDKTWISLKNNRKIFYTKLPPGKYTFEVKGSNSEGIWNDKVTQLSIIITPPYWAKPWAYLFYTIIITSIIFIIFWYYYLALNEKNRRKIDILEINKEREIYNAKIEFFTNVAHEIRTPLTLIKMPLDKLITKQIDDPDTQESLNMMRKNTNRLIDLTNQLLDFRKAEANKLNLNFINTDINEILNDVYATFKPIAEQRELIYRLDLPRITLHAYVDAEAFKKIISNLFNNAIKYSDKTVIVKLLPFSSDDDNFNIEFRNDGSIISNEHKHKIFEPFYRIETTKEAGTGIGLPFARSLAELHKGQLQYKDSDTDLNIFLLSMPIHQDTEINLKEYREDDTAAILNAERVPEINHSKPFILLVEDNKEILNYLSKELNVNYNIKQAGNGHEAIEALLKDNIQLIISDIMMPVMDGIELCRKLKNDLNYSHIPIILLTAKNSLNSKIEGLDVGADAYIEKPFSFEHLLAQMSNLLLNRNIIKEHFARSPLTHIKGIAYSKADKDFLEKLNTVIYDQISDMDLDVDQLSNLMNMSRPTLYRKIKGLSNLTPHELISLSRLKKAAELLAEGNYKINEIANMVGYSLPTNFSRDFQKQFGISPSVYLSNLKADI
ncbi:hybrid sensor histidine kinase/response regulator transcription factor [Arcticibacter eurypsychrophilus]|uniref:hybrid sensor histidine kinase/response regulator transcription factor n=1 Tax=Arcticibacter eurypsychrophilus TaxID=1434752 RepID=UPI00084D2037|nr:hybrid sensor histidine kinase/response regulator transcription factor [Arcticibacter eurypsychrophilus]